MTSPPVIKQDQILAETSRALQRMRPSRLLGRFLLETAFYSTILIGVRVWSSESLADFGLLRPGIVLGVPLVLAALSRLTEFRQLREFLRTTDDELADQVRRDWRWVTGRWWPVRMGGLGAVLGTGIGTFAGVMGAIIEPGLTLGTAISQALIVTVPILTVLFLLVRFVLVARIASVVESESGNDLPNSA